MLDIDKKWQTAWEKKKIFQANEKKAKKKFYVLEMFAYPSGEGLHMGHTFNFTIGDIFARFKRMQGYNVLYPFGYDSLGLPAENAAIQAKIHPKKYTEKAISNFIRQQKALGFSYDWTRLIKTHNPEFYKWDQWIFLQMLKKGIAYRKKAPVNYCPKCQTVLANEQVHDGKCWRHKDTEVQIKMLEQWFFKITNYANELFENIKKLKGWPEDIKAMQENWINKSHGTEIDFEIDDKISNCIIIHGCPDHSENDPKKRTYDKHWIPWTKKQLEKKGIKTSTPIMPTPWKPKYEEWKKEFEKNQVNENTIFIGHSCGCAFLVRWLGETKQTIKKLILVAPWKIPPKDNPIKKSFYEYEIDLTIKSRIGKVIIFTSDDEIKGGKESVKIFHKILGGELIELKKHGHYTQNDMGTTEFPELLEKIVSGQKWPIFTTRSDTIYGVTFMVISAQHPQLLELIKGTKQEQQVKAFVSKLKGIKQADLDTMEKEGVFTGKYAINPINNEKIPVWAGNFVLAEYGSGMVMAVPGHDQRDFEFAKKYHLPIREVISGGNIHKEAFIDSGVLVNSGKFNGMKSEKAIIEISKFLEQKKKGKRTIQFKLKDWLISRQRYWGTPIPIVYCDKCGIVPVPENQLPVILPEKVQFGKGNPLATNKAFIETKCPKCKGKARRETDTMDTFVNSSWYFLRYCDPRNNKEIFKKEKIKYWMPVDQYIGGREHATGHLIYSRFYTKFLRDLKLLSFDEPFSKLFNQGMIHKDGYVMSKSRGNVIDPLDIVKKYNADTLRLYLISNASLDKDFEWSEQGIESIAKFIKKVEDFFSKINFSKTNARLESKIHTTIKQVTQHIENFQYYLAIIELRKLFDYMNKETGTDKKSAEIFLKLFSVFCPHICEELWHKYNKTFISTETWPKCDEKKINMKFEKEEQQQEKLREDVRHIIKIIKTKPKSIFMYIIPKETEIYEEVVNDIKKEFLCNVRLFSVNDKNIYDPQNKAKKAKPGKPAVYVE